jgi:hypothetical protein
MKIYRFLLAILMILPLLQACQGDITDLEDPRDAIVKQWRVTDDSEPAGKNGYDVTISKDIIESTRVLFTNFHGIKSVNKLYAKLAGLTLTIPNQTLDGVDIFEGEGIISDDFKTITFSYTYDDGNVVTPKPVNAYYGPIPPPTKKKTVRVSLPVQ